MAKKQDTGPKTAKPSRSERKRQKKQFRAEQLALEKKLVDEGKIPVRNRYVARGFFWRVLGLCLAFTFGMFAAVGGFLGFASFAPAQDVLWLVGIDYAGILQEDYAKQSFLDIAKGIAGDSFNSLADVAKYTPILDTYLEQLNTSFTDLGAHVDLEALKATTFDALGAYFKDEVLGSVVLGDTLGLTPQSDGLILGICYGAEGTNEEGGDYTVQDGKIVMNEGKKPLTIGDFFGEEGDTASIIDKITIESALGVTASSNAAMRFLAYGTQGTHYDIRDGKVVMLENEFTGKPFEKKTIADLKADGATPVDNARISDLVTIEGDTGILSAIRDWRISDLQDTYRIERLRIDQLLDIGDDASNLVKAIADWRIGDMTDSAKMDSLTLGDVMTVNDESPLILRSLKDTPIGEFGNAVDGLRLADILETRDLEGNNFLRTLSMSSLDTLSADIEKLSAADVFGDDMYSFLLAEENGNKGYAQLVKEYGETGKSTKGSPVPKAHAFIEGESVQSYYSHAGDPARLAEGYVYGNGGVYTVVPAKDVHTRAAGEEKVFYAEGEQPLKEQYDWQYADYKAGKLVPLPEGDAVSADLAGHTLITRKSGTPYTDGADSPLYYLTARETAEGTENVAYPLFTDDYGIYYTYLKYTEGGGAEEYREERVDLDYTVSAYTYERDGDTVTIAKNADGKWAETGTDGTVNIYEKKDGETSYRYIKTEITVLHKYFAAPAEGTTVSAVYDEGEVTQKFEIAYADRRAAAPADRYLSGVWFFLFGTDEDEDGNFITEDKNGNLIDNSHSPVLELTDKMPAMTGSISDTPLWLLYLHGLINTDPYVSLEDTAFAGKITLDGHESPVSNLNECTVVECIALVDKLIHFRAV